MEENFIPTELDFTNDATIKASMVARVGAWNTYFDTVNASEIAPLFHLMRAAKESYFTALSDLKKRAHELATESTKLQSHLLQQYAPGLPVKNLDISYSANRHSYISENEITTGKIIY